MRSDELLVQFHATGSARAEGGGVAEAGHGAGPSAEFFALVSRDFCEASGRSDAPVGSVRLWLNDEEGGDGVHVLHPAPFPAPPFDSTTARALKIFETIGGFMGKAIVDARPLDLPFSDAFIGALRGDVLDARAAIASFDPAFARSFAHLEELVRARDAAVGAGDADALARIAAEVDGSLLDFTVPGVPHAAFPSAPPPLSGTSDAATVTVENLHIYVDGLATALVGAGIAPAVHALLRGLRAFSPDPRALLRLRTPCEWRDVLSGDGALADDSRWTEKVIRAGLVPASHYGATSPQLDWLAAAVAALKGPRARRLFLRFVSGAARLPPSGLRISVYSVERRDGTSDTLLPSCSTCTVSLKLPRYSNAQILAAKLNMAIEEGQENFSLD